MVQPLRNYLPGFASLLEQIDKRVLVLLRDGRSLFGVLRSIDQFANLVLHLAVERIYIGNEYGEIDRGVFLIRGENVVLCGEIVSFSITSIINIPLNLFLSLTKYISHSCHNLQTCRMTMLNPIHLVTPRFQLK